MAVQMRDPVTKTSACSAYVTDGAVRLFLAGYLATLRYDGEEDGHLRYTIPSETQRGALYSIDYEPAEQTLRCSCKAGQNNVPCKHVRLLQLRNGWATQEGRA
jgi:hypothetical protein